MKRLCLVGDPVENSLSPAMHGAALRHLRLDRNFSYEGRKVASEELAGFMRDSAREYAGMSVTMPHKVSIIQHLDGLSDEAKLIGAANTVVRERDGMIGHNTVGTGCLLALGSAGVDVGGKSEGVLHASIK
mgnify:CR=1 FL=1